MQRTVLLYAVAGATLIGALLLAPKIAPPEVVHVPDVIEPKAPATPLTRLTFGDALVTVDARLDRGIVLRDAGHVSDEPVFLDVTLRATDTRAERPQVATLLVIDRSGSMAGEPIAHARRAAKSLVSRLADGDRVALVSYGTDVTVDLPWVTLDESSRARAKRSIDALYEGGGTNIDGGLKRARALVGSMGAFDGVVRVMLLSDGRANEGERRVDRLARHAEELRAAGATVSALGLGLDYNEELLERLATTGSGRYRYLRHARDLGAILDDELEHASRVVARNINLVLRETATDLTFVEASGAPIARLAGNINVLIGDLAAGEERRVLLKLTPGPRAATAPQLLWPSPEVAYTSAGGGARLLHHGADTFRMLVGDDALALERSRDADVRVRALQVASSLALTKSMEAYAKGDVGTARRVLEENRVRVEALAKDTQNAALHDEAQQLQQVLQKVESAAPSSAGAQDLVKYQRARAFDMRR